MCGISKLPTKCPTALGWNPGLEPWAWPFPAGARPSVQIPHGHGGHWVHWDTSAGWHTRSGVCRGVQVGSPLGPVTLQAGLHVAAALIWRVGGCED